MIRIFFFFFFTADEFVIPYEDVERPEPNFPVPVVENVYSSWKPVNHGHPLRDATVYYAPPTLERVALSKGRAAPAPVAQARSDQFPLVHNDENNHNDNSRYQHGRSGESAFARPVVVKATPKEQKKSRSYSVYGSPDVNYSNFYDNPPKKPVVPQPGARRRSDEARREYSARRYPGFSRNSYHDSAVGSRSADGFSNGPRNPPYRPPRQRPVRGGGIQYMEPPTVRHGDDYYPFEQPSQAVPYRSRRPQAPQLSIKPAALERKHSAIERRLEKEEEEALEVAESQGFPVYVRNPDGSVVKKRKVKKRRKSNHGLP